VPLCCPDNSETLSGCFRNQCPDVAEIRIFKNNKVTIQDFNTYCCFYFRSNIGGVNGEFCGHVKVGVNVDKKQTK
jgi:hypothetical protein